MRLDADIRRTTRRTIRLPKALDAALDTYATAEGLSFSDAGRELLADRLTQRASPEHDSTAAGQLRAIREELVLVRRVLLQSLRTGLSTQLILAHWIAMSDPYALRKEGLDEDRLLEVYRRLGDEELDRLLAEQRRVRVVRVEDGEVH
jgi:hypothetical protein